jgi:predicted ATPase
LATRHALLVLDNAEHLIDAVAAFVAGLSAATRLGVLLTSQEPAHVPGEQLFRVGPLGVSAAGAPPDPTDGALALLVARSRAIAPNLNIETDADALAAAAEICRRLDGIPLAIELAAARLPLLGVEGVRRHLDERLRLLTAGHRTGLRRHQTLRAAFDWSHQLLSAPEQALFARLAVFVGGFSLEAAQQVGADAQTDPWAVVEHLGGLVDKSMVVVTDAAPVPRYALLETARAYALEKLAERGETDSSMLRHAQALKRLLRIYEQDDRRWRCSDADNRAAAAEVDNVRAALAWLAERPDLQLLGAELAALSFRSWFYAGLSLEGARRCMAWWEAAERLAPPETVGLLGFSLAVAVNMRRISNGGERRSPKIAGPGAQLHAFAAITPFKSMSKRSSTISQIRS